MVKLTRVREIIVEKTRTDPISGQRNAILGVLVALCAAAWAMIAWQGAGAHLRHDLGATPSGAGMRAAWFVAMWMVMTVAMMFPTAAPMILAFHKVQASRRRQGHAFVASWVFLCGYLLVWAFSGLAAYAGALAFEAAASRVGLSPETAARLGGAVLLAAGLYQLTPLKAMCLSKCRTPVSFIMTSWRDGAVGALHMGAVHGVYCLGCCWLLCAVMFPLGMTNIAALALVTAIVFAEKTLPWGGRLAEATGGALAAYGLIVIAAPQLAPL